ncbi:hypothetical protein VNO78_21134 [Psophocarpus tetragonolobus]|uniref:Uncharacterized protein n=1 Tax=Psophocarpus tetragonolobus TaxID=3891 RepID=A0AAN9SCQ0_PSOTE
MVPLVNSHRSDSALVYYSLPLPFVLVDSLLISKSLAFSSVKAFLTTNARGPSSIPRPWNVFEEKSFPEVQQAIGNMLLLPSPYGRWQIGMRPAPGCQEAKALARTFHPSLKQNHYILHNKTIGEWEHSQIDRPYTSKGIALYSTT